jgi:hypothetical protein
LHSSQPSLAGLDTWSDDTGRDYHTKAGALLSRASEASELMKRLGWLATQYGEDIGHTKTEIAKVIDANSGYYFRSTFPLTSWAYDPGTSQRIVTTLASSINAFIDAMADRIAARGATGADLPRPQFVPSELPNHSPALDAALPGDPRHPPKIPGPKQFDPQELRGLTRDEIAARIPDDWTHKTSKSGDGEVFKDPVNHGRQIRIMPGYPPGSRPDPITWGPYAVVSQNGPPIKIPLAGNPTL